MKIDVNNVSHGAQDTSLMQLRSIPSLHEVTVTTLASWAASTMTVVASGALAAVVAITFSTLSSFIDDGDVWVDFDHICEFLVSLL